MPHFFQPPAHKNSDVQLKLRKNSLSAFCNRNYEHLISERPLQCKYPTMLSDWAPKRSNQDWEILGHDNTQTLFDELLIILEIRLNVS